MDSIPPKPDSCMNCFKSLTDWAFAWSLDTRMVHSAKDGYSAFNALAGFGVAQGVALSAVAKEEGRTGVVVAIYLVAVIVTTWWTIKLLHATRLEDSQQGGVVNLRAFDLPSIQHGRFTLTWILIVATVLVGLALNGLLPNQTSRQYFSGDVQMSSHFYESRPQGQLAGVEGSKLDRQSLDAWLSWVKPNAGAARLLWLQQSHPFSAHYRSVNVELSYDVQRHRVSQRVAFLIRPDNDSVRPVFRQMKFELSPPSFDQSNRFTLVNPDPGETLVVLCLVENIGEQSVVTANDFGVSVKRR